MESSDDLLASEIAQHKVGTRTDSAALLSWFLENVWRIEPEEIVFAICDGPGDKGIDALLVDEDQLEITIFQTKHRQNPEKSSQGDSDLKSLVGAADWFESPDSLASLLASKPNQELVNLIERQEVARCIGSGSYAVKLVFVTNADLDASARGYMAARAGQSPILTAWSRTELVEVAQRTRRPELREESVVLPSSISPVELRLTDKERMVIAVVPASELVKLPGIHDYTLFSRNVRLFAGRTRINRELRQTVRDTAEHRLFPAYHNGLTLLTGELVVEESQVRLNGVGVVNGCQSLVTLHDNRDSLTDSLQLLVKVVEVTGDAKVADQITYRSNNQNAVTMRDQRSGDPVMRDLQTNVGKIFGNAFGFQIKVGENLHTVETLENTLAAQLITAFYLEEPWSAVRKVRLFDHDYRRIFNRSITPHKLWLLHLVNAIINDSREGLRNDLKASFASVKFTLVHLVGQLLRLSIPGEQLIESPERWLREQEEAVKEALRTIAAEIVDTVNYFIGEEIDENPGYDPKIAFKNRAGVKRLESAAVRDAKRQAKRDTSYLFSVSPVR